MLEKITKHQSLINLHRESLFEVFAPIFCFSSGERSFPTRVETYIENVVMAKYKYYTDQQDRNLFLSEQEEKELGVIKNYFIKDSEFNSEYASYKEELDFQEVIPQIKPLSSLRRDVIMEKYENYTTRSDQLHPLEKRELDILTKYFIDSSSKNLKDDIKKLFGEDGAIIEKNFNSMSAEFIFDVNKDLLQVDKDNTFLTFDEKLHGYILGSRVPYMGIYPQSDNVGGAPIFASIIPTTSGAMIKYEYFYALSDAIPMFKWLYQCLPYALTKRFDHFGLHPGDFEGVYVKVDIDDSSVATLHSIQFFGHGRSASRDVPAENLTYRLDDADKARPCVFVGNGTHPSYADNFWGVNKFCDNVGDSYSITPKEFIDLSPDIKSKGEWPVATLFQRVGQTSFMMNTGTSYVENEQSFLVMDPSWHQYKPCLWSSIFPCCMVEGNSNEYSNTPRLLLGEETIITHESSV